MSLFDLQDVCIAIGSIATLDLPMVVDLIGIYGLKGPYCTLTTTNWFLQALSVIPRGSWGDVARRFTMIRWAVGMDVLSNYRASVDCFHGIVRFRPMSGEKWDFYGQDSRSKIPLVSGMEMFSLLSLGNSGFMIYALDASSSSRVLLSDVARGVVRRRAKIFRWQRPPAGRRSGDVVTADLISSRVWFGPVPGSP
ncbi:hypothetical protein F511_26975 [Dorcoceras hygrometricum]|uniref:Uncharacterized protein n=1 Tax=Dorcoceras hygrometricum TaxID=472368 RepID=A0A2Z7BE60_9LAMI|nr:hypothetical protein F511_26975 [Dorcoceras hygrometricum]